MIDKLIKFAKEYHEGFKGLPDETLRRLFETYKFTTLVQTDDAGEIAGFAIYQDWPDCHNFIAIAGKGSRAENLKAMLKGRQYLTKKIAYFDEEKMELKELWEP